VTIRRATTADLDGLLDLIQEFYLVDQHDYARDHVVPALTPLLADDALGQVWVIEEGAVLTGYAMVTWSWSVESGGREGGRLLEHAFQEAAAFGARAVFLETEAPNDQARRFYERHGFDIEASIWMSRQLPRGE
jgi:GNAT superfamily N-acetyltransferase